MKITLTELSLTNFKGIPDYTLYAGHGENLEVWADNGYGKTTLFDGFLWLLFGKDSQGKADFQITPVDADGHELHELETSVKANLDLDGKVFTLEKVFEEKWTKKRGSAHKTLTGHTTRHLLDGVPVQKKHWDSKVGALVDESTFRLLTSPTYFNAMPWQDKRNILLRVCGDIADQDVIDSDSELQGLPEILQGRTLDDHKAAIQDRKKEVNKELQQIPARIDELKASLPEHSEREQIRAQIAELETKVANAKAGLDDSLWNRHLELMQEIPRAKCFAQNQREEETRAAKRAVADAEQEISRLEVVCAREDARCEKLEKERVDTEEEMQGLRDEFKVWQQEPAATDETCPTCGQSLPEDQIQAAQEKHRAMVAEQLRKIQEQGKALKAENDKRIQKIQELSNESLEAGSQIENLRHKLGELRERVHEAEASVNSYDEQARTLEKEDAELLERIEKQKQEVPDTSSLEAQIQEKQQQIAAINAAEKTQARIKELSKQEKDLAREYEDIERQLDLMGEFIVSKVRLLEGKINSRFDLARFKLFETTMEGAVRETCETLYGGVPYSRGLNLGARINVGLDIIRTLSEHYDVKAPVFIDNAESVSRIIDPETQTIKLVMDPESKQLVTKAEKQESPCK